jgi:hypothetical protein
MKAAHERRAQPQRPGRLVDRRLRRKHHRLGHPRRDDEAPRLIPSTSKLEHSIAPCFADKACWAELRRHCIAMNGSFFNTHRMLGQYVANAYFPLASSIAVY